MPPSAVAKSTLFCLTFALLKNAFASLSFAVETLTRGLLSDLVAEMRPLLDNVALPIIKTTTEVSNAFM